jgi:hypothetical protein
VSAPAQVPGHHYGFHKVRVYRNRAASIELTRLDQLRIADITYIRLETEFVYLAASPGA